MGCAQSVAAVSHKDADLLEQYELTKKVGMGMEGEVWLAKSRETGDSVALKLVRRGYDDFLGPRIKREVQLQAKLSHVNIAELRQVLLTPKHLCLVMDYQEGGDLHSFCAHKKIDEEVARYLFRQIIAALEYCHSHRIAHRDLKLANFLLDTNRPPRVKLTDFGCAREWVKSSSKASGAKLDKFATFIGTPAYMAPQVLESAFYPTKRYSATGADVWACGILLCHIFFGAHTPYWMEPNAFQDDHATQLARLEAMRQLPWSESDKWLQEHAHELSDELQDLLSCIFVADESQRITIQGIKEHPWVKAPLNPKLEAALREMADEQEVREHMGRAAVSRAAQRVDAADGEGRFATLELLVTLGYKRGKMPGTDQRLIVVDMAHMDTLDTSSTVTSGLLDTVSWASPSPSPTPDASVHKFLDASVHKTPDPSVHRTPDPSVHKTLDPSVHKTLDPSVHKPLSTATSAAAAEQEGSTHGLPPLPLPVVPLPLLPAPAHALQLNATAALAAPGTAAQALATSPPLSQQPSCPLHLQSPFASLYSEGTAADAPDAVPIAAATATAASDQSGRAAAAAATASDDRSAHAAFAAAASSDRSAHTGNSSGLEPQASIYRSNTGGLPPQLRRVLSLEKRGKGSMVVARYGLMTTAGGSAGTYSSVHGGASYYDQRASGGVTRAGVTSGVTDSVTGGVTSDNLSGGISGSGGGSGGSWHGAGVHKADARRAGSAHAGTFGLRQGGSAHSSGGGAVSRDNKDSGNAYNAAGASLYGDGSGAAAPAALAVMHEVHGA